MKNKRYSPVVLKLAALAASGLAASSASAASNVSIYGVADIGVAYTTTKVAGNKTSTTGLVSPGQGASRLGFKGTEEISPDLKVNFQLESGINLNDGSTLNGRHFGRAAWLGIQGHWGELRAGRQTLPSSEWFAPAASPFGDAFSEAAIGKSGFRSSNTIRNDRLLKYFSPKFGAFDFSVAYSFNSKGTEQKTSENTRLTSLVARFRSGGTTLVSSFDRVNPANSDAQAQGRNPSAFQLGGNYQLQSLQLYAAWARQKEGWIKSADGAASGSNHLGASGYFDGHVDAFLLGAKYVQGVSALFGTIHYTDPSKHAFANAKAVNTYNLGYSYDFSKRTQLYGVVSYRDGDLYGFQQASSTRQVVAGINHKF